MTSTTRQAQAMSPLAEPESQTFTSHELSTGHRFLTGCVPEGLNAFRLREDRMPEGTCLIPALERFFRDEDNFAIHLTAYGIICLSV